MSKDSTWLLSEIKKQIDDRLSPEMTQTLLAEVRSHLDTGIRARVADGIEQELAEIEAVSAFGRPEAYVNDLLAIHEGNAGKRKARSGRTKADRSTIVSFLVSCIWCMLYFTCSLRYGSSPVQLALGLVCVGAFAVYSFRARRIQILEIALVTPFAFISAGVLYSLIWLTVWHHGAEINTTISVWEANSVSRLEKTRISQIDKTLASFQVGLTKHFDKMSRSELDHLPPEIHSILLLPLGNFEPQGQPTLHPWGVFHGPVVSQLGRYPVEDAIRQWKYGAVRAIASLKQARVESEREISGIAAAQKIYPLGDIGTNLFQMQRLLWFFLFVGIVLNLISAGIGQLVHSSIGPRIRRRLA